MKNDQWYDICFIHVISKLKNYCQEKEKVLFIYNELKEDKKIF